MIPGQPLSFGQPRPPMPTIPIGPGVTGQTDRGYGPPRQIGIPDLTGGQGMGPNPGQMGPISTQERYRQALQQMMMQMAAQQNMTQRGMMR